MTPLFFTFLIGMFYTKGVFFFQSGLQEQLLWIVFMKIRAIIFLWTQTIF